jgi:pimeloyl-ACP methyl ester carboxylesterase
MAVRRSVTVLVAVVALATNACSQAPPPPAKPVTTTAPGSAKPEVAANADGVDASGAKDDTSEEKSVPSESVADASATDPGASEKPDEPASAQGPEARAAAFVDALAGDDFEAVTADFDETMAKVMPAAKLKQTWDGVQAQYGKFKQRRASRVESTKAKEVEYDIVFVTGEFEKGPLDVKVVYTKEGKVTGLFFTPAKPSFAGKEQLWLGTLNAGGAKLRILIHLGKGADGKPLASLDSLDQGQKGLPLDVVTWDEESVKLEGKALGVVYEGKLDETGKELKGEWKQGGATLPLDLQQVDSEPQANRPQTPKRPFPYNEIEVAYENTAAGVKIAGTLTVPRTAGPHPAVLLITGSGAQDRDETIFNHKPFLVLADYLTRREIAVLRVDDRGVGGSTTAATEATTADLAEDVRSGIEFLKSRPEIDAAHIGLIGHSEGGTIAPLVASQSADVAFIVMLAGSAVTGEEVLYQQGAALLKAAGASDKVLAAQRELQSRMFTVVKATPDVQEAVEKMKASIAEFIDSLDDETRNGLGGDVKATVAAQAPRVAGNWFRFLLTYDPRSSLEKTRCPVLALNGQRDLQVLPQENLAIIREALTAGGNADFEIHELPRLNHLFQTSTTGQVAEYGQIEETFAPSALEVIGNWIVRHTEKSRE